MKKVFTLAVAALLMTGFAFANEGDKKKGKGNCKEKKECKKVCSKAEKKECSKAEKKETATEAKQTEKAAKKA